MKFDTACYARSPITQYSKAIGRLLSPSFAVSSSPLSPSCGMGGVCVYGGARPSVDGRVSAAAAERAQVRAVQGVT